MLPSSRMRLLFLVIILLGGIHSQLKALDLYKVMPNGNFVYDYSEDKVISSHATSIEHTLRAYNDSTGSQIIVFIAQSLNGAPLEDLTYEMAERWDIGREEYDDGILIFVAIKERKIRIEVGEGLEGPIPDIMAKRIIDDYMTPQFKSGNFGQGIADGVNAILSLISGEDLPPPSKTADWSPFLIVGSIFLGMLMGMAYEKNKGIWLGLNGGYFIALIALMSLTLAFKGVLISLVSGFVVNNAKGNGGGGHYGGGGWSSGGGWSGGGSSFGGFSGGGGSFGGGGASGGW